MISTLAEKRLIDVRGAGQPGKGRNAPTIGLSDIVWDRFSKLLANDKAELALQPISEGENVAVAMNELESPTGIGSARVPRRTQTTDDPAMTIAKTLPKAERYLKRSGSGDLIASDDIIDESYWGLKGEAQVIDPRSIKEHSNWRIGNHTYWLIRSFFDYGEQSRNWLFLLHGESLGSAKLADITIAFATVSERTRPVWMRMARLSAPESLPQLWDLAGGPSPSTGSRSHSNDL